MSILNKYIPQLAIPQIEDWLTEFRVFLKITAPRKTKFGDYRAPRKNKAATITINNDLNQYHFLITLVHEIAHASVWDKYKSKAKPHGKEWQMDYKQKLNYIISLSVFPEEMLMGLSVHLSNIKASTCSDHKLYRLLKIYDKPNDFVFLAELEKNAIFELKGGRRFVKGEKRRTRYLCRELGGKRKYTISANAEVKLLKADEENSRLMLSA